MSKKNNMATIPFAVFEAEQTKNERLNKRLFIIILVLIAALIATNLGWLIYEKQFETITESETTETYEYNVEQEADGNGNNNFIGGDGEITNGKTAD